MPTLADLEVTKAPKRQSDVLAILHDQATIWRAEVPAAELEFLNAAAGFLDGLAGILDKAQTAAAKREKERDSKTAPSTPAPEGVSLKRFCLGRCGACGVLFRVYR